MSTYPTPIQGQIEIAGFRFQTAEILPHLRLHYTTIGEPQRDRAGVVRNAVLILHGTGGSGQQFLRPEFAGELFGPNQPLDANRFYLILPDGIGHGRSSKPSAGLRTRFPHYGYHDMVTAHYRLLTEGLGVNHLRLVMGTSMGGMHTWLWGERYPDFMDALMPLACLPVEIAGRNRMIRRMIIDAIRTDPEWRNGDYTNQPPGLVAAVHALLFMISSPLQWQKQAPTRAQADHLFDEMVAQRMDGVDANDMLYYFRASEDYNPQPELEKIKAPLLAINSADDQVNPPELGLIEEAIQRVARGRFVLLPISDQTRGHGTHTLAALWRNHLSDLLTESAAK